MRTIESNRDWSAHWASVAERAPPDDLFRQVERTIGGKPEPPEHVALLLAAIARRLDLGAGDTLLDLCCGNGLLTARLAPLCRAVVGADFSPALVAVARERSAAPNTVYLHRRADDLHKADFPLGPPTKICMNSGMQHFTVAMADRLLHALRRLTQGELALFFTDVPDAAKLAAFYDTPARWAEFERRRAAGTEAIGTWWDRDHFGSLLKAAGYEFAMLDPDPGRATARYRFDVLARLRGSTRVDARALRRLGAHSGSAVSCGAPPGQTGDGCVLTTVAAAR